MMRRNNDGEDDDIEQEYLKKYLDIADLGNLEYSFE